MKYKVIHKLKERRFADKISKSEETVLDYLQKHFNKIPDMTVLELSEQSYTSQATINRACKILGFSGFSELKYAIKEDLAFIDARSHMYMNKTEFFLEKIDFESAKNITRYLTDRSVKVMIYGLGASKFYTMSFEHNYGSPWQYYNAACAFERIGKSELAKKYYDIAKEYGFEITEDLKNNKYIYSEDDVELFNK